VALLLVAGLVACGGGDGGGGETVAMLHLLVINHSDADVTVGYSQADTPAEDQTVATCSAEIFDYPLADPYVITINGETAVDSSTLAQVPGDFATDIVTELEVAEDGSATAEDPRLGSRLSKPPKLSICV
jgi:hypothetical protein